MTQDNIEVVEEDVIDLFELFGVLYKSKKIIIGITILAIVISVVIALVMTPQYKTSTKIIYQSAKQGMGQLSSLAALAGVDVGGSATDPSAYLNDIIVSNEFLDSIIAKKWKTDDGKLVNLVEFWKMEIDSTEDNWKSKLNFSLKETLKKGIISYSQDKKTGVITISTLFADPQISYDMNRYIVDKLNNFILTKMHFKAKENRKFVENRLSKAKEDLREAEEKLRRFKEKNIIASSPALQLQQRRLLRDIEIANEIYLQLQKQYELSKIEEKKDIPVLDVIDIPIKPVLKDKPKRKIIVVIGTMFGFFVSIFLVFVLEWWKNNRNKIKEVIS